jgi:tetratricopeptide (TPR) repeat protein
MRSFTQKIRTLAVVAAAGLAGLVFAQEQGTPPREYSVSDAVSEFLSKDYKTAMEAKNYDAAIAGVEAQFAKVADKTSFDAAVLLQSKAQALLQKSAFSESIEPLERCLQLSDAKTPTYFDERISQEFSYFLAQLYFQEGSNSKVPAKAEGYFEKAEAYMNRWMKNTKKQNPDVSLFYASLLYNRATQNPDHPDEVKIKKALEVVEAALRMSARPKDNLYVLKLVCLQNLGRNAEATDLLELLVKQKPDNRNYWQQLAALYLGQQKDIPAILTFERAQSHGFMNSPKDNFNLVGIHFNIGQYERAAELLEKGLTDGTIEGEEKNWELLAFSYQQMNRDFKAIDALKRATKIFPKSGQLEYLIAQNYYSMEKNEEALPHLQAAVAKGGGNKPHQTYLFLAFIAYELKKFDVALDAAERAIKTPEGKAEGERMKQAIQDIIKEREAKAQRT